MGGMGRGQSKNTPLECMLKIIKKGFNRDYRVKLTSDKLRTFCETDWPASGVGWPLKGSLDKVIVNRVFEVVVGDPGHSNQFPYIDCWQDAVLSQPTWLNPTYRKHVGSWQPGWQQLPSAGKNVKSQRNPY
jgi:hypothetical protein